MLISRGGFWVCCCYCSFDMASDLHSLYGFRGCFAVGFVLWFLMWLEDCGFGLECLFGRALWFSCCGWGGLLILVLPVVVLLMIVCGCVCCMCCCSGFRVVVFVVCDCCLVGGC